MLGDENLSAARAPLYIYTIVIYIFDFVRFHLSG